MNAFAALVSKLGVKTVSRETQALCELFDAHRALVDDGTALTGSRLDALERKVNAMHARLTRSESE